MHEFFNNIIGIIVTCPIAKEIGSKYGIAPKRLASLVDIFACAFLALMPHEGKGTTIRLTLPITQKKGPAADGE